MAVENNALIDYLKTLSIKDDVKARAIRAATEASPERAAYILGKLKNYADFARTARANILARRPLAGPGSSIPH